MDNGNMNGTDMNNGGMDNGYNNTYTNPQQTYYTPQSQPVYQQNVVVDTGVNKEDPVTLGEWLLTFLLLSIPCVGIVMFFVYMFTGKKSRRNYMLAALVWGLIVGVISTIICLIFGATMAASLSEYINRASYYGMMFM